MPGFKRDFQQARARVARDPLAAEDQPALRHRSIVRDGLGVEVVIDAAR
jgi:hypothetical protein